MLAVNTAIHDPVPQETGRHALLRFPGLGAILDGSGVGNQLIGRFLPEEEGVAGTLPELHVPVHAGGSPGIQVSGDVHDILLPDRIILVDEITPLVNLDGARE